MPRKNRRKRSASPRGRTALITLLALGVFGLLGTMPLILTALNLHLQPVAATSGYGVALLPAPRNPRPVLLPAVARPIDPNLPAASLPAVDPAREAALVSAEDGRIRILLHAAVRVYQPEVVPVRASLPTLVLTAGSRPYTAASLAQYGALVFLKHHGALLLDNVFVSTNAKLDLGSARLRVLYMDSSTGGFASIVSWGGDLAFTGTRAQPLTIMGWDRVTKTPAVDRGYGRSYIRDVGGKMTLANVRVSSLGFWSGRTGGVAWTGVNGQSSTGGATRSTFTDDTYGAFVDRGQNIRFTRDLFEFNELDGLHIHRYSVGTSVTFSSSSRNGGNGFLIDRATQSTLLREDVAQNNEGNGYLVDGRPLVNGASASGSAIAPGSGATIERSAALYNERTGILVEGGTGTVLRSDQVCARVTGIAARYDATDAVITGNDIRCAPRSGLSIGPTAPGAIVSGNTISGARVAILVRSSGRIEVDNNLITGATVFGITARGLTSQVRGVGNVISGTGFRAVDARADASKPALSGTNTSGWLHHVKITFWSYLLFHPLAALWLSIAVLVIVCYLWSRRRRLPPHPYPASTRWRPAEAEPVSPVPGPAPVPVSGRVPASGTFPVPVPVPGTAPVPGPVPVPALATGPERAFAGSPATGSARSEGHGRDRDRDRDRVPSPAGSAWHRPPAVNPEARAPGNGGDPVRRPAPARHRAPMPDSAASALGAPPARPARSREQVSSGHGQALEREQFGVDPAWFGADDPADATRPLPQVVD